MMPIMRGIGLASLTISINLHTYYMALLAWSVRYIGACFNAVLPWSTCDNPWNTPNCFRYSSPSVNASTYIGNISSTVTSAVAANVSSVAEQPKVSSVVEFWERGVLDVSKGVHELGSIKWDLLVCLIVSWLVVYFCIWKGIEWTSKIIYFTASFPLLMLLVLFVRGVTLDGAYDGIVYYLKPNITKLQSAQVWADAATQVFYSYSLCNGIMVTMGSYNVFHHNIYRDTIVFSFLNSGTSFFAGFSVFTVLGFMAKEQNTTIDQVAESGPGLVFITYPRAIALMPLPQLWGILFFIMIFLLGLDSEFIGQESIITAIVDLKPRFFSRPWRREIFIAILCFVQFLVGLLMITQGGVYIFNMYDNYAAAGWVLFFIGICECVTMSWLYTPGKFWDHVCQMLGFRPVPWFKFAWACVAPTMVTAILIYSLVMYEPLTYNRTYTYPLWAQALCWLLVLSALQWIPTYAIYRFWKAEGTISERWAEVKRLPAHLEAKLPEKFKQIEMQDCAEVPLNEKTEDV
uniref:Sodium- and chloride-dependent GABA transporter 2-like n=1 Tax=Phallusia mammillata TaxID=59560 RepID=A0A6F9DS88_9ASCI|nr:sodium- and chloride-dependent GABA transporter 2-like [Phallusia mammillata]